MYALKGQDKNNVSPPDRDGGRGDIIFWKISTDLPTQDSQFHQLEVTSFFCIWSFRILYRVVCIVL